MYESDGRKITGFRPSGAMSQSVSREAMLLPRILDHTISVVDSRPSGTIWRTIFDDSTDDS
jgi:hypothetical protein